LKVEEEHQEGEGVGEEVVHPLEEEEGEEVEVVEEEELL
jgi:hypothetical protein